MGGKLIEEVDVLKCIGCAPLQSEDSDAPGYVPNIIYFVKMLYVKDVLD